MCVPVARTNRLFVDRRVTNCFEIRFLRELCARPGTHILPFRLNKRESNSPLGAISSLVYFHLCVPT